MCLSRRKSKRRGSGASAATQTGRGLHGACFSLTRLSRVYCRWPAYRSALGIVDFSRAQGGPSDFWETCHAGRILRTSAHTSVGGGSDEDAHGQSRSLEAKLTFKTSEVSKTSEVL